MKKVVERTRIGKRRMVKRYAKLALFVACIGFVGVITYNAIMIINSGGDNVYAKTKEFMSNQTGDISNEDKETYINENMGDESILIAMNQMCHQKVIASDKWGAIEMNRKHIKALKKAAKNSVSIDQEAIEILDKWDQGDFSGIVDDHNTILSLQGGTVGKATGTMDEDEEKEFIKNNFR
jgi:hypothetical protein